MKAQDPECWVRFFGASKVGSKVGNGILCSLKSLCVDVLLQALCKNMDTQKHLKTDILSCNIQEIYDLFAFVNVAFFWCHSCHLL
jgi:hypothetical protein